MRGKLIAGITIFVLLQSFSAFAQTTYIVDQGGGGDFTAIQDCIAAAVSGDTCEVNEGTYRENIDFLGNNVTVVSSSGPAFTIIDGTGSGTVVNISTGEGPGCVLDGFTIRNGLGDVRPHLGPNSTGGGIYIENSNPLIRNNIITDNTAYSAAAMTIFDGANPVLVNNIIHGNMNEVFLNRTSAVIVVTNGGPGGYDGCDPKMVNNTIVNNVGGGITVDESSGTYTNNIIALNVDPDGDVAGLSLDGGSCNATVTFNLFSENGIDFWAENCGSTPNVHDNLFDQDPSFDGGATHYRLGENSPCIDAGVNTVPDLPTTDIEGDNRIIDGDGDSVAVVDMGADEFVPIPDYPGTANTIASRHGKNSLIGSGSFNSVTLLLIPLGAVIALRILRRRKSK